MRSGSGLWHVVLISSSSLVVCAGYTKMDLVGIMLMKWSCSKWLRNTEHWQGVTKSVFGLEEWKLTAPGVIDMSQLVERAYVLFFGCVLLLPVRSCSSKEDSEFHGREIFRITELSIRRWTTRLSSALPVGSAHMYINKIVPVLNWLSITPWKRMGEWRYRSKYSWSRHLFSQNIFLTQIQICGSHTSDYKKKTNSVAWVRRREIYRSLGRYNSDYGE
jgi:hypothetical protein